MPSTLDEIVANKRAELAARECSKEAPPARAQGTFLPSLLQNGIRVIAEIKPKSPSAGTLNSNIDLKSVAKIYSRYAAAISVLTDEKYFGGSFEALKEVSAIATVPTLCKDFILDTPQVHDARRAGAEAVLLIVKILTPAKLAELHDEIIALNMVPVVEIQNEAELQIALNVNPKCILINNRNLETFEIDLETTARLQPLIPADVVVISASGIDTIEHIDRLGRYTNRFLVGSSLMRSSDIDAKLRQLCKRTNQVKVCGITSVEDAQHAIDSGADLIGLIFVESSPRKTNIKTAKEICAVVGAHRVVGVFKDTPSDEIALIQKEVGFRYVQLHGSESASEVSSLRPCIKAVSVACDQGAQTAVRFADADFLLFDLPKGSGSKITIEQLVEWINEADPPIPFFVAGALTPTNVRKIIDSITAKHFVGVDVASGVESAPGVKSGELVKKFIEETKANVVPR